jgi:hypothetical protein
MNTSPVPQIPIGVNKHLDLTKCAKAGCLRTPQWKFSFLYMTQFGPLPLIPRECGVCELHRAAAEALLPVFADAFAEIEHNGQRITVDRDKSRCLFEPLPKPC